MEVKSEIDFEKIIITKKQVNRRLKVIGYLLIFIIIVGFFAIGLSESSRAVFWGFSIGYIIILLTIYIFSKSERYASFILEELYLRINSNNKAKTYYLQDVINLSETYDIKNGQKVKIVTVSYLEDNQKKSDSYALEFEVPDNLIEIANKMINWLKNKVVLYNGIFASKEVEVTFLGITKHNKSLKNENRKETKLIFMSKDYKPLFFKLGREDIDVDTIEIYKKYKVRFSEVGKFIFVEENNNDIIDIYKVNQLKEDLGKIEDEILYNLEDIKEEIKLERKNKLFI